MSPRAVLYLPGNGHAPVRLEAARAALLRLGEPFALVELRYPHAASFEALLDDLQRQLAEARAEYGAAPVYATGIGALVALALRARGELEGSRVILQGGVLWGLERRWFPRVMRIGPMPRLLAAAFRSRGVQRHFAAKHLRSAQSDEFLARFFAGYRDARAFAAWFDWLRPELLRALERQLRARAGAMEQLAAWWGAHDSVVGPQELRVTERALGARIPLRTFPDWGHYPMIDAPEEWVEELRRAVATAGALP